VLCVTQLKAKPGHNRKVCSWDRPLQRHSQLLGVKNQRYVKASKQCTHNASGNAQRP